MTVIRRIARPMLASIFVTNGIEGLLHPQARAQAAAPLVKTLTGPLNLPNDPELLVRANSATMLAAGTMLGLGKFPRVAALALALAIVPNTYTSHAFWSIKDPAEKAEQRGHFLKNVGLLGGVLLASVDTAGKPGLAYRTRHVQSKAQRQAVHAKREARHAARSARRETRLAVSKAHDALT